MRPGARAPGLLGDLVLGTVAAALRELAHQLREIDAEQRLRYRGAFRRGADDGVGELRCTTWVDDRDLVDVAQRCRGFSHDRRHEWQGLKQDRRLVELAIR